MTDTQRKTLILKALIIPRTRTELARLVGWNGLNKILADFAAAGFICYNQSTKLIEAVNIEVV